jgi:hypothetical protein
MNAMKTWAIVILLALGLGYVTCTTGCAAGNQVAGPDGCTWSWKGSFGRDTSLEGKGICMLPEGMPVPGTDKALMELQCSGRSPWVEQWFGARQTEPAGVERR